MTMYARFGLTLLASFVVMHALSYSMIRGLQDWTFSPSNLWLSAMMTTGMGVLMMLTMGRMFPDRRLNTVLLACLALLFVTSVALVRSQAFIGNEGFLRSMIPHHSRAIVVCEGAAITDPRIRDLCGRIIESQRSEIDEMQALLKEY